MKTGHLFGILLILLTATLVVYRAYEVPPPTWSTGPEKDGGAGAEAQVIDTALIAGAIRQDPAALRMEQTTLRNQLANLKSKYPLLDSPLSDRYNNAWNEARYQPALYRLLQPLEQRIDQRVRAACPSLETYATVLGAIRNEFYRVGNDRSLTNRSEALGQILTKEKAILATDAFVAQSQLYERLSLEALRQEDLPEITRFNEAMESAVALADPGLRAIARQGKEYCLNKAALCARFNQVNFQLAALEPVRKQSVRKPEPAYVPPLWTMY